MNIPGSTVPHRTVAPELIALGEFQLALLALSALVLAGFFAVLRSALLHSVPSRVLEKARGEAECATLRPLLERAEALATSASVFEVTCQIGFVICVFLAVLSGLDATGGAAFTAPSLMLTLLIAVPLLVFAGEVLPSAVRGERSDQLLRSVVPAFDVIRRPLIVVTWALEGARRALMRLLRVPENRRSARRIVEGLRDVIEDSERVDDLRESEREIIENVVEFYDVDVAEVMTPRTELTAVEVSQGAREVARAIAESGHTRIPVFEKSLDSIVGVAFAQEILKVVVDGELDRQGLKDLARPVHFVPETKLVSELLTEFRRDKQKMAVVLDEYGGTSGIVTMGDVVAELVGEMREELGEPAPEPLRRLPDGAVEVQGTTRMSEVNEELELDLPEEKDYDTLAGFVLSELGRFPKRGESFARFGIEFTVTESSDRRVLKILLRWPQSHSLR